MKIKNKLIAGGLMSVVACALVGSITGTFAWYQYSNQSTVSMKGASIGSSQNLQLAWASNAQDTGTGAWTTANLTWADIKAHATMKGSGDNNEDLLPSSQGGNNGEQALSGNWYGNPTGGTTLPNVTSATSGYYVQFTFYARYQEIKGSQPNYPSATIYVDQISNKTIAENAADVTFALRMHVKMGDSTYFLVNPYDTGSKSVTLSSTYSEVASQYDWTTPAGTPVTVGLPSADSPGTLTTLKHEDVVSTFNADGSVNSAKKSVATSTASGVPITVTFWLEGFAQQQEGDSAAQVASDWWDAATTVGTDLQFGFQLRGVKDATQPAPSNP